MTVFREMLRVQYKWTWGALIVVSLGVFATPMLSIQGALMRDGSGAPVGNQAAALHFLSVMERTSVLYTLLAAGLGLSIAMLSWRADHRGRHVYALSLPIQRWQLVLNRFAGGSLLLLIPAVILFLSGIVSAMSIAIPDGLHAYPAALALRFFLASFVAYALFFAISSGTGRSAAYVLAPLALLIVADIALLAMDFRLQIIGNLVTRLFEWPGIMEIFTGRWLLIDV